MGSLTILLAGALVCLIGLFVQRTRVSLGYGKEITYHDTQCKKIELPAPSEDLTYFGDGHCVIAGVGDSFSTFYNGSAGAHPGGFLLVNATEGKVVPLEVQGKSLPKLIPHGIYFSQSSRRLYAVNHDEEHGESVEVFELSQELVLKHVGSARSSLFNNFALNDVVEGMGDEFYVTEWLQFGVPRGGKWSPAKSKMEMLHEVASMILQLTGIKTTRVFRCSLQEKGGCSVASSQRFVAANGITISKDKQSVFVNDPPSQAITVLQRKQDGSLEKVSEFSSKHALDNIEMGSDGEIPLDRVICA